MKLRLLLVVLLLGAGTGMRAQSQAGDEMQQPQELPAIQLNAGIHLIVAQLAITPEQRRIGLMFRQVMAANEGMLFVFPQAKQQCFWMKNTLLPLSVAFLADDGSIVNIEDMAPKTLDLHCPVKPVRFALEMHQGWFDQRGITAGARLEGAPFSLR